MQSDAVPGLKRRKLNLIDFETVINDEKSMTCTTDVSSSDDDNTSNEFIDDKQSSSKKKTRGRVKIKMEFIENKLRRYTTFSKRKAGIMKKAYELATLTGTQVMLLVASETGHVYTFATKKLQPMITSTAGKALIQTCLSSPGTCSDNMTSCYEQPLSPPSSNEFEEIEFNVNQDSNESKPSLNNYFDLSRQGDLNSVASSACTLKTDDNSGANALLTVPISCLFLQKLASNPLMLTDENKKFSDNNLSCSSSEPGRVFDDATSLSSKERFIQPFITIPLSIATFANASCVPNFQPSANLGNILPSASMTSFQQQ